MVVDHLELLRPNQATVAPGQAHRLATGLIDQTHNVLLHLAGKHPLHYFHGFSVGHAHALDELALFTQAVQRVLNLRPAAMHHHRVDAHQFEQHHVFGKVGLQFGVGHGVAAILDHHGLAMELADIRQRLRQDVGLLTGGNRAGVGG